MSSKVSNSIDMRGNRLLNVAGLTDASGNPVGFVAWAQVATYQAMLNLGVPANLTFVKVTNDEDKGTTHQEYDLWPDGQRIYNGNNDKLVDYTKTGSAYFDGASPWANDGNYSWDKVFDSNINTWFHSGTFNPWVARDLGAAKPLSRFILTPVQDSGNAGNLNGAQAQYSTDNNSWTNIGPAVSGISSTNYTTPYVLNFTATTARYWRIYLSNYGYLAEFQLQYIRA